MSLFTFLKQNFGTFGIFICYSFELLGNKELHDINSLE